MTATSQPEGLDALLAAQGYEIERQPASNSWIWALDALPLPTYRQSGDAPVVGHPSSVRLRHHSRRCRARPLVRRVLRDERRGSAPPRDDAATLGADRAGRASRRCGWTAGLRRAGSACCRRGASGCMNRRGAGVAAARVRSAACGESVGLGRSWRAGRVFTGDAEQRAHAAALRKSRLPGDLSVLVSGQGLGVTAGQNGTADDAIREQTGQKSESVLSAFSASSASHSNSPSPMIAGHVDDDLDRAVAAVARQLVGFRHRSNGSRCVSRASRQWRRSLQDRRDPG